MICEELSSLLNQLVHINLNDNNTWALDAMDLLLVIHTYFRARECLSNIATTNNFIAKLDNLFFCKTYARVKLFAQ